MPKEESSAAPTLFQIVYCSTATRLLSDEELEEILHQSRSRNEAVEITGLLMYHYGGFVQALEGPELAVNQVFASIQKDRRHHTIQTIIKEPSAEREFADWHMAFRHFRTPGDLPLGFKSFLDHDWSASSFTERGKCHALLHAIRDTFR